MRTVPSCFPLPAARAFAAGTLVTLGACGGSDDPKGYSDELKQEFVAECTEAGSDKETCGCMYDTIEAELPFERYQEIEKGLRSGRLTIPAQIEEFAVACAAESDSTGG